MPEDATSVGKLRALDITAAGRQLPRKCGRKRKDDSAEVEPMARDLVAVWLEVPADPFDVAVDVELPAQVRQHLEEAARQRDEAAHAQAAAAREYRAAARELKAQGLTVRESARLSAYRTSAHNSSLPIPDTFPAPLPRIHQRCLALVGAAVEVLDVIGQQGRPSIGLLLDQFPSRSERLSCQCGMGDSSS